MIEAQRELMYARNDFESKHVNPAQRLLVATATLVAVHQQAAVDAQAYVETMRPVWAQGWTTDSEAAQASAAALAQLWQLLGVDNQTHAVQKLEELMCE